jgi:hypothetical protein
MLERRMHGGILLPLAEGAYIGQSKRLTSCAHICEVLSTSCLAVEHETTEARTLHSRSITPVAAGLC